MTSTYPKAINNGNNSSKNNKSSHDERRRRRLKWSGQIIEEVVALEKSKDKRGRKLDLDLFLVLLAEFNKRAYQLGKTEE